MRVPSSRRLGRPSPAFARFLRGSAARDQLLPPLGECIQPFVEQGNHRGRLGTAQLLDGAMERRCHCVRHLHIHQLRSDLRALAQGANLTRALRGFRFDDEAAIIQLDMADTKREPQKTPSASQPERPVAEHEPLTVTVIEPAASHETSVRVPHDTGVRPPERVTRIAGARWYWVLFGVARRCSSSS
jgi:hypothetical protein